MEGSISYHGISPELHAIKNLEKSISFISNTVSTELYKSNEKDFLC